MGSLDKSYPPLFAPGFHEITESELETYFVDPFRPADRRAHLTDRLRALISHVHRQGLNYELWIDGSFCTEKHEPEDVDLLFVFDADEFNALPPAAGKALQVVFENRTDTRLRYACDVYAMLRGDQNMRSYWRGWFGFTREEAPKGIPFLTVGAQ